ncbi:MAG: type II secretion system F family protein [Sheuella sp.]|nr:type II secretion system F family protein [Sheuella sp.]
MTISTLLILLLLIYLLVTGISFYVIYKYSNYRMQNRLLQIQKINQSGSDHPDQFSAMRLVERIFIPMIKWSKPDQDWESSPDRIHFLNAGFRTNFSVVVFYGFKTLLAIFLPILFLLYLLSAASSFSLLQNALICLAIAVLGYYTPDFILQQLIRVRRRELFESFPDALDLMRVCVSAGLGLDSAIARVGQELSVKSRALGQEFHILNLELRAGISREQALHNLALRSGIADVNALVAMLIQSERFGTSVTVSLRVHADELRNKRKMKAQEMAAKVPVKLTVPMILCIFPVLFIVLLGPAVMKVLHYFSSHS